MGLQVKTRSQVPLAERVDRFKMNRAKGKLKHMLEEYGQRGKLQVCCTAQAAIYVYNYIYIYMCYKCGGCYLCLYLYMYIHNICKHIYMYIYTRAIPRRLRCMLMFIYMYLYMYCMHTYTYLFEFFPGSFADVQGSFACEEICLDMYLCAAGGVGAA